MNCRLAAAFVIGLLAGAALLKVATIDTVQAQPVGGPYQISAYALAGSGGGFGAFVVNTSTGAVSLCQNANCRLLGQASN